jgi:hypothetical protein
MRPIATKLIGLDSKILYNQFGNYSGYDKRSHHTTPPTLKQQVWKGKDVTYARSCSDWHWADKN